MPQRRTTVNYDVSRGTFRVSREIRGQREPLTRSVPFDAIEGIGDMDLTNLARQAMYCPGRDFVVGQRVSA
jgi:hypothetical protein